ncbi:DUF6870 family protein [Dehalobacter restrictus]|jgi:CxxC motif-containing protein|uniref:DUF6870 family protein n=1 Tax=Dehalobacter restrictus TaxID=55583 RepID=UPI0033907483
MDKMTGEILDAMRNVDIRTVDPSTLVDIRDVKIKTDLPKEERILDFIRQIKNPYCFKCGDLIIKSTFADTEATLEDRLKSYFRLL